MVGMMVLERMAIGIRARSNMQSILAFERSNDE